jgi:hypothetical protein
LVRRLRIKERIHPQFTVAHALSEIQDTPLSLAHFLIPLKPLLHFDGDLHKEVQLGIPFHLKDYLHVVDWTGRVIREDKHGSITQTLPPILQRLSIEEKQWVENSAQFERRYRQRFQKRKAKTA